MQQQAPRLQSARWPGLGASSTGSLCKSANPREEKRGLGLGQPVRRLLSKASKTIFLTVACLARPPQTESWERKKHGEQWRAPRFFLLFFTRSLGNKGEKDNQTMRLFSVVPQRICGVCMGGFFFLAGAELGSRPGSGQGDRFLRPKDARRRSLSSQQSLINSQPGDWRGAMSPLASKPPRGRARSSGERQGEQVRLPGWIRSQLPSGGADHGSGRAGRCKY